MTEPVKPVNNKTQTVQTNQPKAKTDKVRIGNVEFKRNEIIEDKTKTYVQNGKKMNTVFVKPGVQIDFPDQNPKNHASVRNTGVVPEWYNPDRSYIQIENLENSKIYGNPNRTDFIDLNGKSKNNTVIVDKKESWYVDGSQRKDYITLGADTSNNTVKMDEKDELDIHYHRTSVYFGTEEVQSPIGNLEVEGKGTSEQELQLKASIDYPLHKHIQQQE